MDKRYPGLLDMRRDPKNDDRNDLFASFILCNLCSIGTASGLLQVKTKLIWHRTMNMSTAHWIWVGIYAVITNITQSYNSNLTNFSFNRNSESPVLILFNDVKRFFKTLLNNAHDFIYVRKKLNQTRMWVDAQRDGCPAEYRWRPLINAAKFDAHCWSTVQ